MIVHRHEMKDTISRIVRMLMKQPAIAEKIDPVSEETQDTPDDKTVSSDNIDEQTSQETTQTIEKSAEPEAVKD